MNAFLDVCHPRHMAHNMHKTHIIGSSVSGFLFKPEANIMPMHGLFRCRLKHHVVALRLLMLKQENLRFAAVKEDGQAHFSHTKCVRFMLMSVAQHGAIFRQIDREVIAPLRFFTQTCMRCVPLFNPRVISILSLQLLVALRW